MWVGPECVNKEPCFLSWSGWDAFCRLCLAPDFGKLPQRGWDSTLSQSHFPTLELELSLLAPQEKHNSATVSDCRQLGPAEGFSMESLPVTEATAASLRWMAHRDGFCFQQKGYLVRSQWNLLYNEQVCTHPVSLHYAFYHQCPSITFPTSHNPFLCKAYRQPQIFHEACSDCLKQRSCWPALSHVTLIALTPLCQF